MRKIYYNGIIYTGVEKQSNANYVITKDNIITEVGNTVSLQELDGKYDESIDLKGNMMMAGFIDAHAHPVTSAFQRSQIVSEFTMSESDVLELVKEYIDRHPEKDSYFGIGHSETIFGDEGPKKEKLDAICKDKPIILVGCGGHDGWVNSKALEITGVDKNYPDPVPGFQFYRRNTAGEATGHILESGPLTEVITAVKPFVLSEVEETLDTIFTDYSSYGVTTIGDCGFACYVEEQGKRLLDLFIERNKFKQRIFGSNQITEVRHLDGWKEHLIALREKYNSDYLRVNTFKVVNDGTIESRSAAMMEPFAGDRCVIEPLLQGKKYQELCIEVAKEGFDIHLHGIGDRANHENLMAAKAVREAGFEDIRITNAHTQCVIHEELELFARYNVIANSTGVWLYGDASTKNILGDRADDTFRLKSILKLGGKISFGSDFPGDEYGVEPLKSIETGITRQMIGRSDSPILKPEDERLSVKEMLTGFTSTPAYQLRMEEKIGSIETGKYADFVVLGRDVFNTRKHNIHNIPIVMTIMDGNVTYVNQ